MAAEPGGSEPAVVVELFTSQGCSSCPPADRLLSRLGREARAGGARLVPLAFHVDYWNRLGWVDPFSSPRWSSRQHRYAEAFGLHSVYTPQVVINGRSELVGSHESRLRAELAALAGEPRAARIELSVPTLDETAAEIAFEVTAAAAGENGNGLVALVALFESGLVTEVGAGENARRTLENDYVVRLLRPAFELAAGGPAERRQRLTIALDRRWNPANLGLAAFLQDPETLRIHAATVHPGGG